MAGADPTIRLRTLGSLQLHDAGGEEARALLAQPRRVALLVYLAVAVPRGAHRRDKLLALFWPEHDETRARNALSQAVHFLRRALGADALINHADDEIGLNRALVWCDALEFEEQLAAGRLDEALELYRGPFLDGVHISSAAPELEQWIDAERTRLGRCHAQALQRMADGCETVGDHAGAAVWLRKLATHDPLDWRTALQLIRALAAAGDDASAIRYARVHEALVREELGISIHPEVAALVRALQGGPHTSTVPPAPSNLIGEKAVEDSASRRQKSRTRWRTAVTLAALGALVVASLAGVALSNRHRADAFNGASIRCLAVLPLENLSRDSSQEYFADGVTDAIITELARHERVTVISRTSVTRYKRTDKPLRTIGRELGCDGIIEGTVSTDGNHVQVNAQLLYAPEDRHLWAARYDGELEDVLALERQIADSVASQVVGVTTARRAALSPVDPVAYGQYLRGRDAFRSRNPASLRQALTLFQQATSRDSNFALAYAGLADAYRFIGGLGYGPRAPLADSARLMAARALALDSTLSEAHTSLAALLTDDAD